MSRSTKFFEGMARLAFNNPDLRAEIIEILGFLPNFNSKKFRFYLFELEEAHRLAMRDNKEKK